MYALVALLMVIAFGFYNFAFPLHVNVVSQDFLEHDTCPPVTGNIMPCDLQRWIRTDWMATILNFKTAQRQKCL